MRLVAVVGVLALVGCSGGKDGGGGGTGTPAGSAGEACGDGAAEGVEVCDGADLGGEDCVSQGFIGGALACSASCDGFDTSACETAVCGNDTVEGDEVCDGPDLAGQSCTTLGQGFTEGDLACAPGCDDWDTSACTTTVSNLAAPCANLSQIVPGPGEEEYFVAARLTPDSYPFTVERVSYSLVDLIGSDCNGTLPHRVEVYADAGTTPPATPVVHETLDVPAGVATGGLREISLDLTNPLTLQAGEHLFVAVEIGGVLFEFTCVQSCNDPGSEPDRNWWSGDFDPPYPWAMLSTYGINGTVMIEAQGH